MSKRARSCVICGRLPGKRGEFLYYRPDGSEVWLCGRGRCRIEYEGE